MGVVSRDSISGAKVQKKEMVYGSLWLILFGSIVCSWPAASAAYAAMKRSALSIANGLTYKKIIDFGIEAYPTYQEAAGHFKYSEMPKTGFLRREASILIGVQPNGTAKLGTYEVREWRLWRELLAAYLRAIFWEGGGIVFLPYLGAIAAVAISIGTGWSGSPHELFRLLYA